MPFNSLQFVYFFPIVVVLYFGLPQRFRWALLLAASYYFYMSWRLEYVGLITLSTLIAYWTAIRMEDAQNDKSKRLFLTISAVSNLGILFAFKYLNFFSDSIRQLFGAFSIAIDTPVLNVLLPVGISFYTFQVVSYSIDVYRGERTAERHLGIFALFVSFFPQLVAGPIERSNHLLPQFFEKHEFDYDRVTSGVALMFWGMFKKVVIADRLAATVNVVFASPHDFDGIQLVLAAVFFVFQIYCDFSAYSDIAIGAARVMGYRLMINFHRPYSARSVSDYWRRWHISLTTWFNDYLYLPSVFKRRHWGPRASVTFSLIVTFGASGLWHGAGFTFIAFGLIHGIALAAEFLTRQIRKELTSGIPPKVYSAMCLAGMFVFICFVDVVFRANTLSDALYIAIGMVQGTINDLQLVVGSGFSSRAILSLFYGLGQPKIEIVISVVLILFLLFAEWLDESVGIMQTLRARPLWQRWAVYYAMTVAFILFGSFNQSIQFIYFQF